MRPMSRATADPVTASGVALEMRTSAGNGGGLGASASALRVLMPGRLAYEDGLALQERLVEERRSGAAPDTLVLLEHDAVVTLGRGADPAHVLMDRARLAARGIGLFVTGRGGDVTLHAPGQVVGYPILALEGDRRDTHGYLRDLEEVMIRVARDFGVESGRIEGLTGTWVGSDVARRRATGLKLGAIGVRIHSGWITSHGFAFNAENDLSLYDVIVPCGIRGKGVTSLARLLGRPVPVKDVMERCEARFREVFEREGEREGEGESEGFVLTEPDRPAIVSGSRGSAGGRAAPGTAQLAAPFRSGASTLHRDYPEPHNVPAGRAIAGRRPA